jgi:hypothetical protein
MDVARAKAIAEVAGVIVESAKVENDFLRITGAKGTGTGFIPEKTALAAVPEPGKPRLVNGRVQSGSD